MKIEYIIIVILAMVAVGLSVANVVEKARMERLQTRLDAAENSLAETQKRLETSESLCNYERAKSTRTEQAIEHFETVRQKVLNPTIHLKEIEHDETSCGWLDAVIPDSVRLCIGADAAGAVCE